MHSLRLLLLTPLIAAAQLPPPLLSGILLERDTSASGQFSVRASDFQVFRFQFDPGTSVEREQLPIEVARLNPGEKVEVASGPVEGALVRYARVIRVIVPLPPRPPARAVHPPAPLERLFTTGSLTFSGVVSRFSPQRLVLHTREGDRTILIRQDTRYVEDGGTVEAASLQPNMRVFVLAGKDLYERLEAYRVIWGSIFDPSR